MANTASAIKRVRQNARRRMRNRMVRSRTRTFVKKADATIATGDTALAERAVRAAISELDRAAQKGGIHRNNAARRKSRLMAKLNALTA
ncbi:MAG TPA: 30S ribosomal protein S20 [Anaerolineae bacterium]|nr:30S ribosomal protein S20 [Anaerolineae bacterium]